MKTDMDWVRIQRVLDAPIETVWKLWTDPEHFKRWYGPNGMSVPTAEMDLTVGGQRKICMTMESPDRTMTMWFVGAFKEISAPTRLVYSEQMSDEAGNPITPPGMPEGAPTDTEVIVELVDKDGKTHMTLTHVGVPADSGGAGGWAQAIDKLAELSASL